MSRAKWHQRIFARAGIGATKKTRLRLGNHVADSARDCETATGATSASPNRAIRQRPHDELAVMRIEILSGNRTRVLAQFRHQHFLLFLIAHFQRAALLMFAARLAEALKKLDIGTADSVRRFKRSVRQNFEIFLRFTHRYWFHEVSEQSQARSLFGLTIHHLNLDALYDEVRDRMYSMSQYLDTDSTRRHTNTVLRLTVVTPLAIGPSDQLYA